MSDIESLFLYILIYTISSIILSIGKKKNSKILIFISILIPTIFTAIRFDVGTDWKNYYSTYLFNTENGLSIFLNTNIGAELGVFLFAQIGKLFDSYHVFFGCFSFTMFALIVIQLKNNYDKLPIGLASFIFLMTSYTTGINAIRQVLSACIVFYGFQYIFNGKSYKYCLSVIVAMFFHSSSIIAFPLFLLWSKRKYKLKNSFRAYIVVSVFTATALILPQIIEKLSFISFFSRFAVYSDKVNIGNNLTFIKDILVFIVIFCFHKYLIKKDIRNSFFYTLIFIGLLFNISGFYSPYLKRISIYFELPMFILLAQIPFIMRGNSKILIYCLMVVYTVTIFIIVYYIFRQSGILPYTISFLNRRFI